MFGDALTGPDGTQAPPAPPPRTDAAGGPVTAWTAVRPGEPGAVAAPVAAVRPPEPSERMRRAAEREGGLWAAAPRPSQSRAPHRESVSPEVWAESAAGSYPMPEVIAERPGPTPHRLLPLVMALLMLAVIIGAHWVS